MRCITAGKARVCMDKNVIISVKGTQAANDRNDGILEFVTEGRYYKKDEAYYVTYDESDITGMNGTKTTLQVAEGVVTLIRVGSVNSQFVFQQGQKHISYYDTEYGAFTVGVLANEVDIKIDDSGGEIRVGYQLEIDNNNSGNNDFYMLIREAGQTDDKHYRRAKGTSPEYS